LINRSNFATFQTYEIEELAAIEENDKGVQTAAWDIKDTRGDRVRLVAQLGCGCSGIIKRYETLPEYSGAITRK
jgi:hypothetical protein